MEFSQVRWLGDAVGSYLILNHVINFALFQCEIVVFLILRPFSIKNSFFWVTWLRGGVKLCLKYSMQKWYRPRELLPTDTWVIFNKLFFVFKNENMDQRTKFHSLNLGFVLFWWRHQFSGPMSTIDGFNLKMDFTWLKRSLKKPS